MKDSEFADLPIVSIVTPSYNSMPYLEENIKSVLSQNYPKLEHIIIDGASNDGSLEILKSFPHLIWISEKDRGQSHAINKGFKMVKGDIIGWLNSDDTYEPNAINTIVTFLGDHPSIDVIYGNIFVIDASGKKIGVSNSLQFDLRLLLSQNFIKQPSVFMRRKVIERLGGLDENLHYVMDREFWLRAGVEGFRMAYYELGCLANFRIYPGTKTFNNSTCFANEWNMVLNEALIMPYFQGIPIKTRQRIVNENLSIMYFSKMRESTDNPKKRFIISNFRKAIYYDLRLLKNLGAWKVFLLLLMGKTPDKLRKYRKQEILPIT